MNSVTFKSSNIDLSKEYKLSKLKSIFTFFSFKSGLKDSSFSKLILLFKRSNKPDLKESSVFY